MPTFQNAFLAEMRSKIWAMERKALDGFFERLSVLGDSGTISADSIAAAKLQATARKSKMTVEGDTAVISITGYLMKEVPWIFVYFGIDATAYPDISADIKAALADDSVERILLRIDSPGGEVAGAQEAADSIFNARASKPVDTFIEDLGASGAYWLASQGQKVTANKNALVGSIGVYGVYQDISEMAAKLGIKVHVIRSGEHKGMGVAGAEITDKQIEAIQSVIDDMADNFVEAVARGRGVDKKSIAKLATGQVWIAGEAKRNGLIDSIEGSFGAALSGLGNTVQGEMVMAEEDVKVEIVDEKKLKAEAAAEAVATEKGRLAELEAAFPNDIGFAVKQFKVGASVESAKAAYSDVLAEKLEASEKEKTELAEKLETATTPAPDGAEPVEFQESADSGGGDFMATAKAVAAEKKISMTLAMSQVAGENPDLHAAYKAGLKGVPRK